MEVSEPWSQQAAWQALLALRPRLRRFASGLTGSLDEADDLVQAVYERAVERHLQWEPGTRFHSWVFKIAHSIWISRKRHAAVRGGRGEPVDPDTLVGCDGEREVEAQACLGRCAAPGGRVAGGPARGADAGRRRRPDLRGCGGRAERSAGTVASRVARARLALALAMEGKEVASPAPEPALARSGS